ncbi:MAG: DUF349 domain-containing protein [Edaphocola sp.]
MAEQQSNQTPLTGERITPEIWIEHEFAGKQYCTFNFEGQELWLKPSAHSPGRNLATLTLENMQSVTKALSEKFKEVETKWQELESEWLQTEDKPKLYGKIQRTLDYALRTNAIGNYEPLFAALKAKEAETAALLAANHQLRLAIVEKAENLKDSDDWKGTSEVYKEIVEEWKNTPQTDKAKSDALWERIENARNYFFERKRKHQEDTSREMMQNLDLKMELCETAEKHAHSTDWRAVSDIMKELMDKWKTIGRVVTAEKNEEIWNRFTAARNTFFERKKVHFEQIQTEQENNLAEKEALVQQAEALAESTDWKETTTALGLIMDKWKTIGKVPYEKADELWNRLQAARDKFFGAKRQRADEHRITLEDNYAKKTALLNRAEALKNSENWREATEELNELMAEWKNIGHIPREYGDEIWDKFVAARQHFFNRKDADRDKRRNRFQSQLDGRLQQTELFLEKIKAELQEEEERLADFKKSLDETTGTSAKDDEIRKQLQGLITQIERKLPARKQKIGEVSRQFEELQQKKQEIDTGKK